MKKLISATILLCWLSLMSAQTTSSIEISRNDYSLIEWKDEHHQYSLRNKDQVLHESKAHFEIRQGKGGDKDSYGVRERRKSYLVSSDNDTIASITDRGQKIRIGDTEVSRLATPDGWVYVGPSQDTLFTANLLWNKSKWKYQLLAADDSETSKTLSKVVMLSMIQMARERSKVDCDDDGLGSLWFILYASTLVAD